jgi:ribosomal protein S18 acetylase RimI-like enzyme
MTIFLRTARESDHDTLMSAISDWWTLPAHSTPEAKRERALLVPRLWLQHFASSSLVAERSFSGAQNAEMAGFLIGFHSVDRPEESYIHFVGVRPDGRKAGVGRALYERFFEQSRQRGRSRVRCITSPTNDVSIAFHRAMGFSIEPGSKTVEGVAVKTDYDAPGVDRVAFVRELGRREN